LRIASVAATVLVFGWLSSAEAGEALGPLFLKLYNHKLHGQVVDYTNYHGLDHRIWSSASGGLQSLPDMN
jgi:hypothetical protein